MVVGEHNVHHRPSYYFVQSHDWSVYYGMHAEYSALWHIDDWCSHETSEDSSIGDRESSSLHLSHCYFSGFSFLRQFSQVLLNLRKAF